MLLEKEIVLAALAVETNEYLRVLDEQACHGMNAVIACKNLLSLTPCWRVTPC